MTPSRRRALTAALAATLAVAAVAVARDGRGADLGFAGSVQLDYLLLPTEETGRDITFDGFTTELSMTVTLDVSDGISGRVKTCYGCHGFEIGSAFIDFRPTDWLSIRAGRFVPAFGDFPERHDPANHLTSDKPLPYDMGRMVRLRDWNMSILPAPYVDSGLQASAHATLGDTVDLDAHAYVVGGLRAGSGAVDVDFIQSRSRDLYYVDNNSRPTVGGRLSGRVYLGSGASVTLGASGMYGTYDPDNELDLLVLGADLVVRVDRWAFRAEYLLRRTKMALGDDPAATFRYGPGKDGEYDPYMLKDGFYAELTAPIGDVVELVGRVDGLRRLGNVPVTSPLRSESAVLRYTAGMNLQFERSWRVKLSGELYDFSDFEDEVGVHLGVVGAFLSEAAGAAPARPGRLWAHRALMLATYVVAVVVAVLVDDLVGVDDVLARALVGDLVATGVVFLASVLANNSSMYDPYWSVAPIALAAFWARAPAGGAADPARVVLVVTLVCVWGGRLTLNFLRRWRGLGDEDFRYRDLRARSGRAYWLVSLTGIHLFPTALVFAGMLPVWAVLTGPGGALGPLDVVAAVVTASAIAVEAVADAQLRRFLRGGPPAGAICATGLWRLSRHPNYFGEVLFWWGLWLFALAASPALAWTAVGALAITALFLGVSLPMMERRSRSRRPAYADHAARTALLVPWPRPRRRL